MAKLTAAQRKKLPGKVFAGPNRSFPMHDKAHIRAALRFIRYASPETKKRIRARAARAGIGQKGKGKRRGLRSRG
jgi:hypothetical protein